MKLKILSVLTLMSVAMPAYSDSNSGVIGSIGASDSSAYSTDDHGRRPPNRGNNRHDDRRGNRRDDRRDDRYNNGRDDRRDDRYDDRDHDRNECRLNYAGRSETTREFTMGACQQRVNEAVVRFCQANPNSSLNVTYRWNGQGETAFFPCRGWGPPGGGPTCTLRYEGRTETTHEVAMGACQQRVNEAVVRYCATHPGDYLTVEYRWDGRGAAANFTCAGHSHDGGHGDGGHDGGHP